MRHEQALFVYLGALVDELVRAGVRHACLAPGSRSTPLAMLLAGHPGLRLWVHLDERSAAFFALGLAKARREPVALLCTSGTAAANFLPAVVEARLGRVPLVVLTADRPPELRDVGAPQTIDQLRLFGSHAKWFVEVAPPEGTADLLRYARTLAARAAATALAAPAGPVHLNLPLREPLVPLPYDIPQEVPAGEEAAWRGRSEGRPYVALAQGSRALPAAEVERLAGDLAGVSRGLIVCGPQDDPAFPAAVGRLAAALGWPVLADPLSQVRCGPHDRRAVIDGYDAFLRDPRAVEALAPEVILRFGAIPTSKPALLYLQRHAAARQIVVDGGDGWPDPTLIATDVLHADPPTLCRSLVKALGDAGASASAWLATWREVDRRARDAATACLLGFAEPFEGRVFHEMAAVLPEGSTLFVGSSMPVRDLDTFFPASARPVRFLANRGANGIDGVVSSALGAAAGSAGPLALVIGDLSLYHDMNGLLAARRFGLDATIVLVNNDGGGIFSFLPQAAHPEHFEALFGTPHGLDFRPVADLYGATYARPEGWGEFRAAVAAGLREGGLRIVEVRTDRERNVALHREVWRAVSAALSDEVLGCLASR